MSARRIADIAAVGAAVSLAAMAGFVALFSEDFHWHVVLGDTTLAGEGIYAVDSHSHTFAGQPMYVSSWLGDVMYALAWRAGGLAGCYAMRAVVLVAMAVLLIRDARLRGSAWATAGVLAAFLFSERFMVWFLRPELFAFGLFVCVLACCGAHQRSGRARWLLIPIPLMALWSNLHGSVGIGLLPLGLYCGQAFLSELVRERNRRRLALLFAVPLAALLASALNPAGFGAPFAFKITSPIWTETIGEWRSLTSREIPVMLRVGGIAAFVIVGLAAVGTPRALWPTAWLAAAFAVLAMLSFSYRRFVTFAEIAAVPLCASCLVALRDRLASTTRARVWMIAGSVAAASAAVWAVAGPIAAHAERPIVGLAEDQSAPMLPIEACRWTKQHTRPGPLFNSYAFGSYLMYCLGREYPVFIDQRAWSVYTDEFYQAYIDAARSPEALEALIARSPATWAIVAHDAYGFALSNDPRWRLVYFDDKALVFGRVGDPRAAGTIADCELTYLVPARLVNLPDLPPDRIGRAREELSRAQAACPGCYRVKLAEAAIAIAAGDDSSFARIRDELLAERETTALAYLAGRHALLRGDPTTARRLFQRYRELGGDAITSTVYEARAVAAAGDIDAALEMLDPSRAPPAARPVFERARQQLARPQPQR